MCKVGGQRLPCSNGIGTLRRIGSRPPHFPPTAARLLHALSLAFLQLLLCPGAAQAGGQGGRQPGGGGQRAHDCALWPVSSPRAWRHDTLTPRILHQRNISDAVTVTGAAPAPGACDLRRLYVIICTGLGLPCHCERGRMERELRVAGQEASHSSRRGAAGTTQAPPNQTDLQAGAAAWRTSILPP